MVDLIWATRGRSWGFHLLLDGGVADPLSVYEQAFFGAENETAVFRRRRGRAALRFADPLGRTDSAGRLIPHDFVLLGPTAEAIGSIDDGLRLLWPVVAGAYAHVWDADRPPKRETIEALVESDSAGDAINGDEANHPLD